jgi:zinc/manganese transport system permease protein
LSLLLAYFTDWPTSFWITALGGLAYGLSHLQVLLTGRRTAPA